MTTTDYRLTEQDEATMLAAMDQEAVSWIGCGPISHRAAPALVSAAVRAIHCVSADLRTSEFEWLYDAAGTVLHGQDCEHGFAPGSDCDGCEREDRNDALADRS